MELNEKGYPIPDVELNPIEDGKTPEEQKAELAEMIAKRNKILLNMGYIFDENGKIIPPKNEEKPRQSR